MNIVAVTKDATDWGKKKLAQLRTELPGDDWKVYQTQAKDALGEPFPLVISTTTHPYEPNKRVAYYCKWVNES